MSKIIFADRQLSVDMISFIGHVLAQMGYERNQVFGFLTSANMSNRPETFGGMALPGRSPNMSMYALWLFECTTAALYQSLGIGLPLGHNLFDKTEINIKNLIL